MMSLCYILICLVLKACGGYAEDFTVAAKATGSDVVHGVVDLITQSCIFDDDKLLLRRIAYAETKDGTANFTFFRNGVEFYGGIWQITQKDFEATKTSLSNKTLTQIRDEFSIHWLNTSFYDLQKPLYSGLAARLRIDQFYRTTGTKIPQGINDQATFWAKNYTNNHYDDSRAAIDVFTDASAAVRTACASPKADIVFLLDGSGSIGRGNFQSILNFVVKIVDSFDISQDNVRIGLIKFSSKAAPQFNLSAFNMSTDVRSAIQNTSYSSGGTTNTAAGLNATTAMIAAEGRHKDGVAVMSIVLTDGHSTSQAYTSASAKRLHQELPEVTVFSVGVGNNVAVTELKAIASSPICKNVFQLSGFTDISSFTDQIMEKACKASAVLPSMNIISGVVTVNQTYYFRTVLPQQENKTTIRLKASNGRIKSYFSWKIPNPNQAADLTT